jgi:hypothetical protein
MGLHIFSFLALGTRAVRIGERLVRSDVAARPEPPAARRAGRRERAEGRRDEIPALRIPEPPAAGNVGSGNRCRSTPIALASCRKTSLQADAGGPIAIPEQMATTPALGFLRRAASSRFWQGRWPSRCLGTAASCHAERIRRSRQFSLVRSPLSNSRYASKLASDVTTDPRN